MRAEFAAVRDELKAFHREREDVIDGMLLALVAEMPVFLLGEPGTAKSLLARDVCTRLEGKSYFEWLLTKFSTPEELFGPVSLKALENDEYRRITTGKLPEADIVFVDELFKASAGILNSLLAIVNEGIFHNNSHPVEVPCELFVGASNELPTEPELQALYDRLVLRYVVNPIQEPATWVNMLDDPRSCSQGSSRISNELLTELRVAAKEVGVGPLVLEAMVEIRRNLTAAGIAASDRRWKQSLSIARARAALYGRDEVKPIDLATLSHILWNDPDECRKVERAVAEIANPLDAKAIDFEDTIAEIRRNVFYDGAGKLLDSPDLAHASEANEKLKVILGEINDLLKKSKGDDQDIGRLQVAASTCKRTNMEICEKALGMDFGEDEE